MMQAAAARSLTFFASTLGCFCPAACSFMKKRVMRAVRRERDEARGRRRRPWPAAAQAARRARPPAPLQASTTRAHARTSTSSMSDAPLVALVVGGTGVVGRYLLKNLASPASCFQLCYSCSRRAADVDDVSLSAKLRSVQVDLLKADGAEERSSALAPLGVTHMFFAGYSGSVEVGPNLALLENALNAVDGPTLQHVHLVTGTKWYASAALLQS